MIVLPKHFKSKAIYLTKDEQCMLHTVMKKANLEDFAEYSWPVFQSVSNKIVPEKIKENDRSVLCFKTWDKKDSEIVALDCFINEKSVVIFRSDNFSIINKGVNKIIYHKYFIEIANEYGNTAYNDKLFIEEDDFIKVKERVALLNLSYEQLP